MELIGKKFNKLTVIEKLENNYYLCKCDCGNTKKIRKDHIINKTIKSCGCLQRKVAKKLSTKHNLSNSKLYKVWGGIKERCLNKNNKSYKNYGGRGITVCKEWLDDFMSFYQWAIINGYKNNLSIDRIDVNGNYEPSNCRWITQKQQCNNTRVNVTIIFNNEIHTLSQWAEITGISYSALRHRIQRNWTVEKALTTPQKIIGNLR